MASKPELLHNQAADEIGQDFLLAYQQAVLLALQQQGFLKEAMVCAFIVMKCEGFTQITDLMDYLDNNRLIAHY